MSKQINIPQHEFDARLQEKIVEDAASLLFIPGVYEATAEWYNNEIIEDWESETAGGQEEEDTTDNTPEVDTSIES